MRTLEPYGVADAIRHVLAAARADVAAGGSVAIGELTERVDGLNGGLATALARTSSPCSRRTRCSSSTSRGRTPWPSSEARHVHVTARRPFEDVPVPQERVRVQVCDEQPPVKREGARGRRVRRRVQRPVVITLDRRGRDEEERRGAERDREGERDEKFFLSH